MILVDFNHINHLPMKLTPQPVNLQFRDKTSQPLLFSKLYLKSGYPLGEYKQIASDAVIHGPLQKSGNMIILYENWH